MHFCSIRTNKVIVMRFLILIVFGSILISACKRNGDGTVTVVPVAPVDLTAKLNSINEVALVWTDKSTNEDGFKIQRKTGLGNFIDIASVGKDITSFKDIINISNSILTYRIYSFNTAGSSLTYSNEASVTAVSTPTIITLPISDTTANTAISGGNITNDGGNTITARGIVWSTNTNPTISLTTKSNDGTGTGSFTSSLSQLTANTTYYVRSYATTQYDTYYGNELTFKTNNIQLTSGLVAYYPFSGNAGDSSGNNNHGTVNGATLSIDRFGNPNKAYNFDGVDDYIVATASQDMASQVKSISVWIYQATNFCQNEFLALGDASSTTWGCIAGNGCLVLNYGRSCTNNISQNFPISFSLAAWHHIVFVSTGVNGKTSMYLDGNFIGEGTTASSVGSCSTSKLYFGVDIYSLPEYLNGYLDDVRIYKRALTQEEISYLAKH